MAHIEKFKAPALGNMCAHYDRSAELERGVTRDNIDPERTHLNYNLRPLPEGVSQVRFINNRIGSLALKRAPRKDAVRMCDCVVTMPRGFDGSRRKFFDAVCRTLDDLFGEENCVSAWVHFDETTPHVHYAFVPVTEDGRLSAKDKLNRTFMRQFHARLEEGVSSLLGVERVGLLLTDEERSERGGEYVGLEEYQEAKRQTEATQERLERLRQREVGEAAAVAELNRAIEEKELEPAGESVRESAGALFAARSDGSRERELEEENRRLRSRAAGLERDCGIARSRISELRRGIFELRGRIEEIGTTLKERMKRLAERGKRGNPFDLAKESSAARERERVRTPGRAQRRERDWGIER